jgi:hypothetical protein
MERGFIPKTIPGTLESQVGFGGVAYVNPNIILPGIEARRWTEQIYDRINIGSAMRKAIVKGVIKGVTAPIKKFYHKVFK